MRFVLATSDSLEHRFVASMLRKKLGSSIVGVVVEKQEIETNILKALRFALKRYGLLSTCERLLTKSFRILVRDRKHRLTSLNKIIGDVPQLDEVFNGCPIHQSSSVNAESSEKFIREFRPDYLLVYGTGIVKDKILGIPQKNSLNLHTGISPQYRGSSTSFWALYNGQPELVGSTIHECVTEIDGGDILCRACASLASGDTHHDAFAKSVLVGAHYYVQVALGLLSNQNISTVKQNLFIGHEYRFTDKTFVHEIFMRLKIKTGVIDRSIKRSNEGILPHPTLSEIDSVTFS